MTILINLSHNFKLAIPSFEKNPNILLIKMMIVLGDSQPHLMR